MVISRLPPRWLTLFAVMMLVSESSAQRPIPIPMDKISSAGKIKAVQNGVVHVVNIGGDQWLLAIDKDAEEVVLRGKATAQWLRPGMAVRFQGDFFKNKSGQPQGEAKEPIKELKVFTPREDSKIGIKEEAKRGSFLSGGSKSDSPLETAPFSVVGVLAKLKGGRMTIAVGKTQIQAKLASDAKIDVDLAEPRFAREGDEIEFEGWHYVGQKERIHATKVWITLAKPLGAEETKQSLAKTGDSAEDASEEQQLAARQIQTAIARVRKLYDAGDYREAAGAVEVILNDWDAFIDSDEAVAVKLLHSRYKQLKLVHAFLEMEGFMLPALRELPNVQNVASR
ncbi:MAG: hypothetical protein H8E66_16540 [Planctomycetes bacterium]|nr:hypothetical protein [Planctomycetota bacterium]